MPREIKFRAWNKETGEMVDLEKITPLALSDSMNTQLALQGIRGLFLPFNEKWPLMQYTGLKDKNGKEIYEGDIVRCDQFAEWGEEAAYKRYQDLTVDHYCADVCTLGMYEPENIEVIGNIYESKELKP